MDCKGEERKGALLEAAACWKAEWTSAGELKQRLVWVKERFIEEGNTNLSCDAWALPRNAFSWITTKVEQEGEKKRQRIWEHIKCQTRKIWYLICRAAKSLCLSRASSYRSNYCWEFDFCCVMMLRKESIYQSCMPSPRLSIYQSRMPSPRLAIKTKNHTLKHFSSSPSMLEEKYFLL